MIASHLFRGRSYKFSCGAMIRVEQALGSGLIDVMDQLENAPRVSALVEVLAQIMNDGAGASVDEAAALVDEIGFQAAVALIGDTVAAAMPEATEKNG